MSRPTGPDKSTVLTVWERAGGCCERCGRGLAFEDRGEWWAIHHRSPRQSGGSKAAWINLPSNLLALCNPCHLAVESDRTRAENAGFIVRRGIHLPHEIPVAHASLGVVFLTNTAPWYSYNPPEET